MTDSPRGCVSQASHASVITLCCPPEAAHNKVPTEMIIYNSCCLQHLLTWFATSRSDLPLEARWYFYMHSRDWLGIKLKYCWIVVCFKIPQKCCRFTVCHPFMLPDHTGPKVPKTPQTAARLKPKLLLSESNIPLHFKWRKYKISFLLIHFLRKDRMAPEMMMTIRSLKTQQ